MDMRIGRILILRFCVALPNRQALLRQEATHFSGGELRLKLRLIAWGL